MQIKVTKYAIVDLQQDFKLNLTHLRVTICETAAVINPVTIKYEQNNFRKPKWKLEIQKEIVEHR